MTWCLRILREIFQAFPMLQTRNTLPLRTELYAIAWTPQTLPSEWPTSNETEALQVFNGFTRQRLTIAIPWHIPPLHPLLEQKSDRALILLENVY